MPFRTACIAGRARDRRLHRSSRPVRRRPAPRAGRSASSCRSGPAGSPTSPSACSAQKLTERTGAAGRDRESARRRRHRRRQRRDVVGTAGRLHAVRVLQRHRAVEIAAQDHAVRSGRRRSRRSRPWRMFDLLILVQGRLAAAARMQDALMTARADPRQIQRRHHQSRQHAERHRRTAALGDRRPDDDRARIAPRPEVLHRRCCAATRQIGGRVLCRAEVADRRQARSAPSPAAGSKRSPMQPNVPTLRESGVDAAVDGWNSLVAPAGTPKDIVDHAQRPYPRDRRRARLPAAHARSRRRAQSPARRRSSTRG